MVDVYTEILRILRLYGVENAEMIARDIKKMVDKEVIEDMVQLLVQYQKENNKDDKEE